MAKFEWSELFVSIEGEAKYSGVPTAYIRFTRCNFQCRGFNNPNNLDTTSIQTLGFNPKEYNSLNDIPTIHTGCDSIYSWDEKFSHMWHAGDENQLADEVIKILPHDSWDNPKTGQNVILSLTGGEPTLRIKFWPVLLNTKQFKGVKHILVETNCSVPLKEKHVKDLYDWASERDALVTWSNSPKLARSGENWKDAIRPEIARAQMFGPPTPGWGGDNPWGENEPIRYGAYGIFEQYFKFVCEPTTKDFDEVEKAMNEYYNVGISKQTKVYIMPAACTGAQQDEIAAAVADMCIERGYIFCFRVQNAVYQNAIGK